MSQQLHSKKEANKFLSAMMNNRVVAADDIIGAADANGLIRNESATNITLTIQKNSQVELPVGCVVTVLPLGTGTITISAVAGVTINDSANLPASAQYTPRAILQYATDKWVRI